MINVLYIVKNPTDSIISELQNYPNFNLRVRYDISSVTENDINDSDVTVSELPIKTKSPCIRIFEQNTILEGYQEAEDFICRPASSQELVARIMRLIEPVNRKKDKNSFKDGALSIDYESAHVRYRGELIHLTLYEYKLLCLLARRRGELVTYSEILQAMWESPIGNEMLSIRVFVNAIRRKLAAAGAAENIIRTHAGKGYSLDLH